MDSKKQMAILKKYIGWLQCLIDDHYESGAVDDLKEAQILLKDLK